MECEKPMSVFCTIIAMDTTNFCYRICSLCEKTLPDNNNPCTYCDLKSFNPSTSSSKRLYRILLSIASEDKVFVVILFDRAARVLFGCSADEFFNFTMLNPSAAVTAGKILEGEMFEMKLSKPKINGNAQNLRAVAVSPLCSDFVPAMETLKKLYRVGGSQP